MFQLTLASAVLLALQASAATLKSKRAEVVPITLDITNEDLAPDGFTRSTIVANGTYPGPPILATKGQTLLVTANNRLTDSSMRLSTSLDFDGIFFNGENLYNEGTPFVTNCPVGPNTTYTYEVPLGNQTGTYWYHSQLSVQYLDGLRGPLIIYDPEDPLADLYDVDDESTIIQVGDWWHNSSIPLLQSFNDTGIIPVSDSGTINGVGRFNGGPEVPFPVINVEPGKRYRFRIINQSVRSVFTVGFDNHNMTVIAADGQETEPHVVDSIEMLAGQRYDVVVTADQPIANYWLNAPYVGGAATRNPNQNATLNRAIVRYAGAPDAEPEGPFTAPSVDGALLESDLRPLVPMAAPEPTHNLSFTLEVTDGKAIWHINGVQYIPPKEPTLLQVLEGASNETDFDENENTFVFPPGSVVQVDFPPSDDDDAHPFHLHGMNFFVVKSNTSEAINTENPIRRDTVAAGQAGTTVRFILDQPGPFFFHCHIFWHMQAGLGSVMLNDPEGTRAVVKPTPEWEALCPAYNALPPEEQ
ncbi:hypothetical protein VKT23_006103 [Stygiomarasmius scandens]|uniref:Laccase n=1 Tax=Marasmiellus scandens TaxID=2682957 RepID=A0ABR1JVL2_9AGAR